MVCSIQFRVVQRVAWWTSAGSEFDAALLMRRNRALAYRLALLGIFKFFAQVI
jgi:hypothetical protein